jgi:putative cardiolipin synthase
MLRTAMARSLRMLASSSVLILAAACAGSASLSRDLGRRDSIANSTPLATDLGRIATAAASAHEGQSGFLMLDSGADALLDRLALIEAAQRSLDLQYYIWNSDVTGRYLAARVYAAAERGVRVRILLDDFNTGDRDAVLAALDAHPQIEVRIYNPIARGAPRWLGIVRDFSRINRRMHNKSFTADGAATIIGGRNIGDEYFDASHVLNFRDRDVLALGPVVEQMGRAFDEFWNSNWAQPIGAIATDKLAAEDWERRRARAVELDRTLAHSGYDLSQDPAQALAKFTSIAQRLVWAPARLVVDELPQAADLPSGDAPKAVAVALRELTSDAQHEVLIESAYLIPGDAALGLLSQLHGRGVRVRALTNSLASNDLSTNHSGYARRREQMLHAGVDLYELRPDAASCSTLTTDRCAQGAAFGLHAKSVVFDRRIVYVGSFNVNLRSALLNTETALIIDSPELARQVAASIEESMRVENSWQVAFDSQERLRWTTQRGGRIEQGSNEPQTSWWRRTVVAFYRLFPLEKYL